MGLFSSIKNTYKKSEAAVVVQNLLEIQAKAGRFNLDPATLANELVGAVWDQKPDMFNGKFGQRPFKIAVAAAALANGIRNSNQNDFNWNALVISLGNILSELEVNGPLYPLNSLDRELLSGASLTFAEVASEYMRAGEPTQHPLDVMTEKSRGMIIGALEERGVYIKDFTSVDDFCAKASSGLGQIMIARLRGDGSEISEEDVFTVGIFVMGAANYTTHVMKGSFEETSTIALLSCYRGNGIDDFSALTGETINVYNKLMTSGKVGQAVMTQVAAFFEHAGDEQLAKVMSLYAVMRNGLQSK